jgi:hypothetical protein
MESLRPHRYNTRGRDQPPEVSCVQDCTGGVGWRATIRPGGKRPATAPMLIFLNEDRAYQNWVTHHRLGFVLDGRRQPRGRGLTLHRVRKIRSGLSLITFFVE